MSCSIPGVVVPLSLSKTNSVCKPKDVLFEGGESEEVEASVWSAAAEDAKEVVEVSMHRVDSRAVKLDVSSLERDVSKQKMKVLCFNLTNFSSSAQLLLSSALVFFFYVIYGYLQELMFRLPGFRPFGWYLTLIQFVFYSMLGFLEKTMTAHGKERKIPIVTYIQLAFYTVATMGLSNAAVGYLNYPTQVIFKCCKLIPVLIGGILIQGKRYGLLDVIAALMMSLGLIWFSLADSQISPNFHIRGYVMICSALVADAIIGNVQEKAMKAHSASNTEVVLYSYSIGCVYIFVGILFTGELFEAFSFCAQYPKETYGYAMVFSVTGYIGISIVLTLVKTFGALVAVTVTTCRKAVTIILSFLFFAKPFTPQYIWAGMIVLFGIYLNVYSKNGHKWDSKIVDLIQRCISGYRKFRVGRSSPRGVPTVSEIV